MVIATAVGSKLSGLCKPLYVISGLPAGELERLLNPANKAELVALLEYHVLSGDVYSYQLSDGEQAATLDNGAKLSFYIFEGVVHVNDRETRVIDANNGASNGVVHLIDHVLIPAQNAPMVLPAME